MYDLITILGPTASGKTKLAVRIASEIDGEIISADSRQVYKFMDIGTGKDYSDYLINGKNIPYHLIDIKNPITDEYSVFEFIKDFNNSFHSISLKNKLALLTGGSMMYIFSVLKKYSMPELSEEEMNKELEMQAEIEDLRTLLIELDSNAHNSTDMLSIFRLKRRLSILQSESKSIAPVKTDSLTFVIDIPRQLMKERIAARLKFRLENGMIEEAVKLKEMGVSDDKLNYFGLEYKYLALFLKKELNYNDLHQKLRAAIFEFAKKQLTWLRKFEREGIELIRLDGKDINKASAIALEIINDRKNKEIS